MNKRGLLTRTAVGAIGGMLLLGVAGAAIADEVSNDQVDVNVDIAALPFTEKDELRRSRSRDEPIGTHCTATAAEIARIYSTSGTAGTPSYLPRTPGDLENWPRYTSTSYRVNK